MKISKIEKQKMRSWVELDKKAINKNYLTFRGMLKKSTSLMSVVKSNAYGHDLALFVKEMQALGVDWFGVDSFEEALEIRKAGIKKPILVLGYVAPEYFLEALKKDISLTISSKGSLLALLSMKFANSKKEIKIHIKVDTGLGRQGFPLTQIEEILNMLNKTKNKNIKIEGLYSHLAVGEDMKGKAYTKEQVAKLNIWEEKIKGLGFEFMKHICASSSTMFFPEFHFDMVRVGIAMYGLWPSSETKQAVGKRYTLTPVLTWKSLITETKILPKGSKIGYDLTEELKRDSLLGVVPVGYWHGYPRALSSKGILSVNGNQVKIIGRISMDMIVIDLTDTDAKVLDEITLISTDAREGNNADTIASHAGTINYELVTRINPEIRRFLQ